MTVYLIYAKIPSEIFLNNIKFIINKSERYIRTESSKYFIGLYAWSRNKEYINEFLKIRKGCKFYILKKMKMCKYDFKMFKNDYEYEELNYYDYQRGDYNHLPPVKIISTKNEYNEIYDYGEQKISEEMLDTIFNEYSDYYWFNDKLIDALDKLSYTTNCDILCGGNIDCFDENELLHRSEFACNNACYGYTVEGNIYMPFGDNKFILFINEYRQMLM